MEGISTEAPQLGHVHVSNRDRFDCSSSHRENLRNTERSLSHDAVHERPRVGFRHVHQVT